MGWGWALIEFDWEGEGVPGGRLFEAGHLLTFSAFRRVPYSRWALIRINTVFISNTVRGGGLFEREGLNKGFMVVISQGWIKDCFQLDSSISH